MLHFFGGKKVIEYFICPFLVNSSAIVLDKSCPGKAEEWTDEELEKTAEAVGYGAVK